MLAQEDDVNALPAAVTAQTLSLSSADLVGRARAGDRAAFEELYHRFCPAVTRRLTHLCGPRAAVADLVQETFVAAYRKLDSFRGDAPVHHWLLRIATNLARTHHRRLRARRWRLWDRPEQQERVVSPLASVDETYPHLAAVHRALQDLSPVLREAVVLYELEQLSLQEMAVQLEISINTAASRVRRGRDKLRKALQRLGFAPAASERPPRGGEHR